MADLQNWARSGLGTIIVIAFAAYLEVQGDACFQACLYRATGSQQDASVFGGTAVLAGYILLLNASTLNFGQAP